MTSKKKERSPDHPEREYGEKAVGLVISGYQSMESTFKALKQAGQYPQGTFLNEVVRERSSLLPPLLDAVSLAKFEELTSMYDSDSVLKAIWYILENTEECNEKLLGPAMVLDKQHDTRIIVLY